MICVVCNAFVIIVNIYEWGLTPYYTDIQRNTSPFANISDRWNQSPTITSVYNIRAGIATERSFLMPSHISITNPKELVYLTSPSSLRYFSVMLPKIYILVLFPQGNYSDKPHFSSYHFFL